VDHADRLHLRVAVDLVPVKRREQRCRGRAVEAGVVEEDFEDARQATRSYRTTLLMMFRALGGSPWVLAAHLIGVFLWIGGLMSIYWIQRIHANAPKDVRDRLTAMERSLALTTDIAAAIAIGCGVVMLVHPVNMLGLPKMGWLHAKLAIVVLGVLPLHGMMRARVKKFSRGDTPSVPQWQWSLLLASLVAIVILVTTNLQS
jgi:uncharacterized membrane protein